MMKSAAQAGFRWFAALAFFLSASASASAAPAELLWRQDKTASARIEDKPLTNVLARLSAVTGWRIFLQPGVARRVSVQFQNAAHGEALRKLLGDVNYALVPQPKGGAKLYVYETSAADATALIQPDAGARPKNWLQNELILSLAPGSKQDPEKLAAELGGKVVAGDKSLNAYRVEFPDAATAEAAREAIAARDDVAYHDNYSFDRPTLSGNGSPAPESLFPVDPKPVARGEQITVALVDTPVQPLDGKMNDFVLPSIRVRDEAVSYPDGPTHATSMAQTLLNSMAADRDSTANNLGKVRIQPIDIYGSSPSTTTYEVAQGLHKAIQSGAQVINLSLGGTGESPMVDYLLEMAHKKEILVFASAGNSPTTDPTFPAANPNAIAVTAADRYGNIAAYANRGSFVDVKGPGSSKVYYNGQTYISTGTSTATAFVSGQAAALTAQGYSASQTADAILKNYNVNSPPATRAGR
jgi:hypothetical protein